MTAEKHGEFNEKICLAPTSQVPNMSFHVEYARLLPKWALGISKAYIDDCAASLMLDADFPTQRAYHCS